MNEKSNSLRGAVLLLGLMLLPCGWAWGEEVVRISEFMASNTRSRNLANQPMTDEDRSYEDWLEIHNAGGAAVDLGGWSLTDQPGNLRKWVFPPVILEADARLVVWASNKDRRTPGSPLHTNFKISASGGFLAIVKRDGNTLSHQWAPTYPPQAPDVSYGLSMDGGTPAFFSTASTRPTPGGPNGAGSTAIPPLILDVPEDAAAPAPGEITLPVTARVVAIHAPVVSVELSWKKMFEPDVIVPMFDNGQQGDAVAGDGIWTGIIAGVSLAPGEMLRWKVSATDESGRTGNSPPGNIPNSQANSSAQYHGTVAQDPSLASSRLPVLHWFSSQATAGDTSATARVAISYGGRFHDNVGVNLHGQSTAAFPKKSYNLNFPNDRPLVPFPGAKEVKDLKLLSNYADKTKARNTLGYELFREAGVAAHFAFPVRVQRNGVFHSLADAVEDADESYLERAGLNPDGALYKLYAPLSSGLPAGESGYEKKTRQTETAADLNALAAGLARNGDARLVFGYDNLDLPSTINMLAALNLTGNRDTGHKNYYLFRDTGRTNEWRLLPWDVDLSFGHNWTSTYNYFDDDLKTNNAAAPTAAPGSGNIFFRFGYFGATYPSAIADMYLRRLRTLRDQFLASSGTEDWHHRRFNEMVALLDPDGPAPSDADLDAARWTPAMWKLTGAPGSNSPWRSNTPAEETARVLNEYLGVRRNYLFNQLTTLPPAQPEEPDLDLGVVDYYPASPDGSSGEYFTLVNRTPMALDISGWTVSGGVRFTFPAGTVIPGTVRATAADPDRNILFVARDAAGFRNRSQSPHGGEKRLVVSGYQGQLSARGGTLELRTPANALISTTTWAANPTPAQQGLRITEIHFDPADPTAAELAALPGVIGPDFEFIELMNQGTTPLEAGGVQLVEGVNFTVPPGIVLQPGQRLVICANTMAFALRYPGVPSFGNWLGRLNNSGERLHLLDPAGENILDFSYDPAWTGVSGEGRSIVMTGAAGTAWNEWELPVHWQASAAMGGSPGYPENGPGGLTYEGWTALRPTSEQAALMNPLDDPDTDGMINLMEYALANPPLAAAPAVLPEALLVVENGKTYPALVFHRPVQATDLRYEVQTSDDLQNWVAAPAVFHGLPQAIGDGAEKAILRLTNPAGTRLWLRLGVQRVP